MHVAQLFHPFIFSEHNKIVEATLPNMSHGDGSAPKRVCVDTSLGAKFPQQAMGERLLEGCQHQRRISALRLTQEKMDMLRHHYIPDNDKLMALADLFQISRT